MQFQRMKASIEVAYTRHDVPWFAAWTDFTKGIITMQIPEFVPLCVVDGNDSYELLGQCK
jgi:hypothetical protein